MRGRRSLAGTLAANYVLVGAIAVLTGLVAVYLSYTANRGLPFVPTYQIAINVPDAAEVVKGADVRSGGARVGQVLRIRAMHGKPGRPPYARLYLALDKTIQPLPSDSIVRLRPVSILGAKYVELTRGQSRKGVEAGGVLPLSRTESQVEVSDAFRVFDPETRRGLSTTVTGLGDAVAGRGTSFNETVGSLNHLLPPLQRVTRVLISPRTDLAGFIHGLAATTRAIEPVADTLGSLIGNGAVTLDAIDAAGSALGQAIHELPSTEAVATRALSRLTPLLADAAEITRQIRPGTRLLPKASAQLDATVRGATPVFKRVPKLGGPLAAAFEATDRGALSGATQASLRLLGNSDFASFSATSVIGLGAIAQFIGAAQLQCNVMGLWARNLASAVSDGDAAGAWLSFIPIINAGQALQSPTPAPDLHANPYPNESYHECEAGNEPFATGQHIGNPPGTQPAGTEITSPPPGVRDLAHAAGLLTPTPRSAR
jgi:virulence factor Mce-like protein